MSAAWQSFTAFRAILHSQRTSSGTSSKGIFLLGFMACYPCFGVGHRFPEALAIA